MTDEVRKRLRELAVAARGDMTVKRLHQERLRKYLTPTIVLDLLAALDNKSRIVPSVTSGATVLLKGPSIIEEEPSAKIDTAKAEVVRFVNAFAPAWSREALINHITPILDSLSLQSPSVPVGEEWAREMARELLGDRDATRLINGQVREAVAAALLSTRTQALAARWQPIEAAPKNEGHEILGIDEPTGEQWIVSWRAFPPGSYADGAWQIKKPPGRDPIVSFTPTHYMPIPAIRALPLDPLDKGELAL